MSTLLPIALAIAALSCQAPGQTTESAPAEVGHLIDQLGSGSYSQRVQATERLISIGPQAKNALLQAAAGDDFEIAVRARRLLKLFDELLFSSVAIDLQASKTRIAWSEEVTLDLRCRNTTDYAARLPFELSPPSSRGIHPARTRPNTQDRLAQVSALLDLADFLVVTAPDGSTIQLHVDDIGEDPQLVAAVNRRVDRPPTSPLPPRSTRVYRFERFNRGWARYRLLRAGAYRIQLVYQPQWEDPEMLHAGVGRVSSKPITITVTQPAPQNVCRATQVASLAVQPVGKEFVATLTNLNDVPVWINLNLAPGRTAPFSALRWFVERPGQADELLTGIAPSVPSFSRERLRKVAPGKSVELGRLRRASVATHTDCEVAAAYTNMTSRAWQLQNAEALADHPKTPQTLKTPLPDRILTVSLRARIPCRSTLDAGAPRPSRGIYPARTPVPP